MGCAVGRLIEEEAGRGLGAVDVEARVGAGGAEGGKVVLVIVLGWRGIAERQGTTWWEGLGHHTSRR